MSPPMYVARIVAVDNCIRNRLPLAPSWPAADTESGPEDVSLQWRCREDVRAVTCLRCRDQVRRR